MLISTRYCYQLGGVAFPAGMVHLSRGQTYATAFSLEEGCEEQAPPTAHCCVWC